MKKWTKGLALAVTLGLMGGMASPVMAEQIYDRPDNADGIVGSEKKDASWLGKDQVKKVGQKIIYDLKDNTTINNNGGANARGVIIYPGKTLEINVKGGDGTLTLNSNCTNRGNGPATGINLTDGGSNLVVNGNLNIEVHSNGNFATGIGLNLDGTGKGAEGHITVNGDVKMRRDDAENPWALTTRNIYGGYGAGGSASKDAPQYSGARWAPSAINIGVGRGSTIDLNGNVDLAIRGNAITTQSYYDGDCTITLNGGHVTIDTPDSDKDHFYVAAAFGGTININSENNVNNNVNLRGNIISMYRDPNKDWERDFYFKDGHINIGLVNDQSKWTGIIDNSGKSEAGDVNIALQNGAIWDHYAVSPGNGLDADHMPDPSVNFYGNYNGVSYVTSLAGGASADKAGYIYQNDSAKINIKNYSGNTVIIYDHDNKGTVAGDYKGGSITIGNAAAGSQITLSTSNTNIDMQNKDEVNKVLNTLAGKLTYEAYVKGETNLHGVVQIASGLTSSAESLEVGNIAFDSKSGVGSLGTGEVVPPTPGPEPEPEPEPETPQQTETNFETGITGGVDAAYGEANVQGEDGGYKFTKDTTVSLGAGSAIDAQNDVKIDANGKKLTLEVMGEGELSGISQTKANNVTIEAKKVEIKLINANGTSNGVLMHNADATKVAQTTIKGDVDVVFGNNNKMDYGLAAVGNTKLVIDGHLELKETDGPKLMYGYYKNPGIWASGEKTSQTGAEIIITDGYKADGRGVFADGYGSKVTINGNTSIVADADSFALSARNGSVNINMNKAMNAAAGANVKITGNILVKNQPSNKETVNDSIINLGLNTADSIFHGVVVNDVAEFQLDKGYHNQANLYLANGAQWVNEVVGEIPPAVSYYEGSIVDNFVGNRGYIYQKDSHDLTIKNYSGNTTIVYEHDESNPVDFAAGDVIIEKTTGKAAVTMYTDNKGIDMDNGDQVDQVLDALAGKLVYGGEGEGSLAASVQVASGLTASAAGWGGTIEFDTDGRGSLVAGSKHALNQINESAIMTGARSAMMDSMLAWRDMASDVFSRAEDLRAGKTEGVWAKAMGGKIEYDGNGQFKNSYWGAQTGYDRTLATGWNVGVAVDYRDGSGDYVYGGEGDTELYSIGAYAGKLLGKQAYVDFAFKAGRIANDYTIYNEIGSLEVDGSYASRGYALSTQIGRRFGDVAKGYFEPQFQLTWAHVDEDEYTALDQHGNTLSIDQNAFDSMVAKLSLKAGRASERGGLFAKLSLAHEFGGDVEGSYNAADGKLKNTSFETSDTWSELTLGGNYLVKENLHVFADITRSLSGDYQHQWKLNAGLNYNF